MRYRTSVRYPTKGGRLEGGGGFSSAPPRPIPFANGQDSPGAEPCSGVIQSGALLSFVTKRPHHSPSDFFNRTGREQKYADVRRRPKPNLKKPLPTRSNNHPTCSKANLTFIWIGSIFSCVKANTNGRPELLIHGPVRVGIANVAENPLSICLSVQAPLNE